MKVRAKVNTAYNRRQNEHDAMMKRKEGDHKVVQRMETGGYKRPGSRNPRKVRGG